MTDEIIRYVESVTVEVFDKQRGKKPIRTERIDATEYLVQMSDYLYRKHVRKEKGLRLKFDNSQTMYTHPLVYAGESNGIYTRFNLNMKEA